ncbi:MAG: type IV pilus assembly protein PilM [Sedimentisphaerales bacterium]|nr:type IV pilus assembly protein PilM [Sedimentisphaerales bacterium]
MAAEMGAVWAIDIGHNSLKALYLSTERGVVEVVGYDNIRHGKILSGDGITDAEREELIAISLRKLVTKYDLSMDEIAIAVPSQNSFARFVNLPPVEAKRIPEMVQFEAVQQIPFGINDVQWDWQLMTEPDSPEIKVGIFAIKNDVVNYAMQPFTREDIEISYVQMAPMALYNFLLYDRPDLVTSDNQATVIINVGAGNTDLVVCTPSAVWQRCILIGGNTFTKAIADTFRLNFEKAEKLKRTAPVSKYARQIFQAMRPVFTDLASEIQRSLGFYSSSNPNTKIVRIIGMGGGTRLRGLLKYLQQTLQIPVERPDSFKRLAIGSGVSQAKFHENVSDFGIVYGLALQGLGLAKIESNLLPRTIARSRAWASKGRYFIAAACILLFTSLLCFASTGWKVLNYDKNKQTRTRIAGILNNITQASNKLEEIENKKAEYAAKIEKEFEIFKYREVIPEICETIISALPNKENTPEQAPLYEAFAKGDIGGIKEFKRNERKQIFLTYMSVSFAKDIKSAKFEGADLWRRNRNLLEEEDERDGEMSEVEWQMMMAERGMGISEMDRRRFGWEIETEEKKDPGFVLTIIGYSPYGQSITELGQIMDPPNANDNPNTWGFITRLARLDDLVADGNSPFVLYGKGVPDHYKLDMKEIDLAVEDPLIGIGQWGVRYINKMTNNGPQETMEDVVVDPLTDEIINKVSVLDQNGREILTNGRPTYKVNDHWFEINLKFIWREAPEFPENNALQGTML